ACWFRASRNSALSRAIVSSGVSGEGFGAERSEAMAGRPTLVRKPADYRVCVSAPCRDLPALYRRYRHGHSYCGSERQGQTGWGGGDPGGRLGWQLELELIDEELQFGFRLGVSGQDGFATARRCEMSVDHLDSSKLRERAVNASNYGRGAIT